MPIAIAYTRFSSDRQQYGDSLRRQQEAVGRWLQQNPSYTLSDVKYEDLGVSGWSGKHREEGALRQLLDAIESGLIPPGSVVLVEALDRFSRLPFLETLNLLSDVLSKGIDLITLEDNQRYNKDSLHDTSRIYLLVGKTQAANEYSNRLSTRVASSYDGRAKKAKKGETIKRRNGFWLTSDGKLKPEEAGIVRDVFTAYTDGVGLRELARQYKEWFANPSAVRKLIGNIATIGHWQRYDSKRQPLELIKNVFEPAIDEVLYWQAQSVQTKQKGMTHPRKWHLAGIVVCAECGGNYATRVASERTKTPTMGCYARMLNKESCPNSKNIPVPVLEAVFQTTSDRHIYQALQKAQLSDVEKERIVIQSRIDSVKHQQRSLLTLLTSMNDDVLRERYQVLIEELKGLETQLLALPTESGQVAVDMKRYMEFMLNTNPLAISKTLQLGGYKIVCDVNARMTVYEETFTYLGYIRKTKEWEILTPAGEVKNTGTLHEYLGGKKNGFKFKMNEASGRFLTEAVRHDGKGSMLKMKFTEWGE